MIKKILFINCSEENIISDTNKGAEAVIVATVGLLRQRIPHAVFASFLNYSERLAEKLDIRVVRIKASRSVPRFFGEIKSMLNLANCLLWAGANKYLHADWGFLLKNTRLREYSGADILVYLGMDYFSEDISTRVVLNHARDILLGILLGKPVIFWAVSAGPFRSRLSRLAVRTVMNRASLITVRDSLSRDFLLAAGAEPSRIHLTSDPAFLLPPADRRRVDEICREIGLENSPVVIGVNPSHSFIIPSHEKEKTARGTYLRIMGFFGTVLASLLPEPVFNRLLGFVKKSALYSPVDSRYADYKKFFAGLIDWLVEEYDARILLVAHDQAMAQLFDDRIVTGEIKNLVKHRDRIAVLSQSYSADEVKGVIGRCDLFIGARFHATIAALSQGIPIVCFPYYHKFALMNDLGLGKYVCEGYSLEETKAKVADAWTNREQIRRDLAAVVKKAEELAALNGELVKQAVDALENAVSPPDRG